jgi:hypothetical protein
MKPTPSGVRFTAAAGTGRPVAPDRKRSDGPLPLSRGLAGGPRGRRACRKMCRGAGRWRSQPRSRLQVPPPPRAGIEAVRWCEPSTFPNNVKNGLRFRTVTKRPLKTPTGDRFTQCGKKKCGKLPSLPLRALNQRLPMTLKAPISANRDRLQEAWNQHPEQFIRPPAELRCSELRRQT